jgi:PAS domain S-box-containing protein
MLNHLPVLLWSTDADLRVTSRLGGGFVSLEPTVGATEGWRVGDNVENPAEAVRAVAAHQAALRGEPTTYEITVRGRTVSARVEPLRKPGGRIAGVVGMAFDVTERHRAEAALRESETRLRTIIETEPDCVKIVDRNGRLLDMNPAGLALIEADDIAQVRGVAVEQIVAPEHRAAYRGLHTRVFEGGTGTLEFEVIGMRGTRRWLSTHAVPLLGPNRTIAALLGITRDITQTKAAEQALRDSEERLQLVTLVRDVGRAPVLEPSHGARGGAEEALERFRSQHPRSPVGAKRSSATGISTTVSCSGTVMAARASADRGLHRSRGPLPRHRARCGRARAARAPPRARWALHGVRRSRRRVAVCGAELRSARQVDPRPGRTEGALIGPLAGRLDRVHGLGHA